MVKPCSGGQSRGESLLRDAQGKMVSQEATRRLIDLEEQRKRGPKLGKVKLGLEGQLGSTFPRSMGMLAEKEKRMA